MPRRKLNYTEGSWFAVPLDSGGYALGIVARLDGRGIVLGYFFERRFDCPPSLQAVPRYMPSDAIDITMFGDLGLLDGEWIVLGVLPSWDRELWPIPKFGRIDAVDPTRAGIIEYNETLEEVRDTRVDAVKVRDLPEDGLAGYRSVELMLDLLITNNLTLSGLREHQRNLRQT